jgi:hypothetical protein
MPDGGPCGGEEIRELPGGPFGGGGGVGLELGYTPGVGGPTGGPVLPCWFGKGELIAPGPIDGVPRREAGFGGPKSGVSFQAGILVRLAAGTIDGELAKLRGGGAIGWCCGGAYPPYGA